MAARVSGIWHTGSTRCGFSTTLADLDKWHTYEGNYTCNFGTIKHYYDKATTAK